MTLSRPLGFTCLDRSTSPLNAGPFDAVSSSRGSLLTISWLVCVTCNFCSETCTQKNLRDQFIGASLTETQLKTCSSRRTQLWKLRCQGVERKRLLASREPRCLEDHLKFRLCKGVPCHTPHFIGLRVTNPCAKGVGQHHTLGGASNALPTH